MQSKDGILDTNATSHGLTVRIQRDAFWFNECTSSVQPDDGGRIRGYDPDIVPQEGRDRRVYLDDVMIRGPSFEYHLQQLQLLFNALYDEEN